MGDFYDGNKLLSIKDLHGRNPELFFCCGNRTAGKTYFFKRWMLRRYVKAGEKFVIFVRFLDDLPNTADGYFADIGPIDFPGHTLTQRPIMHGKAYELLFDEKPCGYVVALNDPERIKRNSAIFADACRGFLDEFMSETGKYCPNEIVKFNSIRLSIARGGAKGTHTRYFPVYLCSNNVTLFNPYFTYFNIAQRITNRCRYLRGEGWVLEQTFNIAAAEAIRREFRTISGVELAYATNNQYLLDRNQFVEHRPGLTRAVATIRYNGTRYGIWSNAISSEVYVSRKYDPDCRLVVAFTDDDHSNDTVLIGRASKIFKTLRAMYEQGLVWFEDGASRHAFISALCIA